MMPNFHFYRYRNNWAVGIGFERTFVGLNALRIGIGWWCASMTWKPLFDRSALPRAEQE